MRDYGIDLAETVRGKGKAPSLVLSCALALRDTSLTMALVSGGREFYGWGKDRHMLADLIDSLNFNTEMTIAPYSKKALDLPDYTRPTSEQEKAAKKVTVADLWGKFQRR